MLLTRTIGFILPPVQDGVQSATIRDQRMWSVSECARVFAESLKLCKEQLIKSGDGGTLVWDKVGTKQTIASLCGRLLSMNGVGWLQRMPPKLILV